MHSVHEGQVALDLLVVFFGGVDTGLESRFACKFAGKSFSVACVLCVHSPFTAVGFLVCVMLFARCSGSCENGAFGR